MGMAKKIKMLMVEKDLTLSELAEKMGTSQPNISNKLKRDNFNEKELNLIAEVLGVKYEANFVLEDGRKI
ncbi:MULTISPECIES: helix-turn-helix transcriptional regulator [Lysinibacillus]|uniref:XRE family transcriptional regulator n=3 Tax=Bacillaceae TaxID=186817 RepID=A0A544U9J2_LYSSH|nr:MULTISPECIES: helix-turn-helix transcriptional regulator [Lysinibacillus]TQR28775.1 XRE family transcriptional regulator [Lysinibacillus sp. SDF0037]MBG9756416.1 transcriptional regulator [Lysinibacillus sphaericus]MBX8944418.1 helix-turn-helix transcriptional regulator [Lysinibacillus sp. K60]MEA0565286.1 helix-turn-helix transcriptional regulator [Lysinibacillus irui]QTB12551.1 helix-turn-helix transcriptional regulator [Lysinibacillus sphaericus]